MGCCSPGRDENLSTDCTCLSYQFVGVKRKRGIWTELFFERCNFCGRFLRCRIHSRVPIRRIGLLMHGHWRRRPLKQKLLIFSAHWCDGELIIQCPSMMMVAKYLLAHNTHCAHFSPPQVLVRVLANSITSRIYGSFTQFCKTIMRLPCTSRKKKLRFVYTFHRNR